MDFSLDFVQDGSERAPGKGFEPLSANAQPLSSENDLEAVAVPLG